MAWSRVSEYEFLRALWHAYKVAFSRQRIDYCYAVESVLIGGQKEASVLYFVLLWERRISNEAPLRSKLVRFLPGWQLAERQCIGCQRVL